MTQNPNTYFMTYQTEPCYNKTWSHVVNVLNYRDQLAYRKYSKDMYMHRYFVIDKWSTYMQMLIIVARVLVERGKTCLMTWLIGV